MSSYVNKKSRVFTQPGSAKVIQKRSESRLKSAKSATDNRAWTDCVEDRRQYILELIKSKAGGLSLGKYIPIEVIIDVLLANKNAQIAELQRQLDAYRRLKLTDNQKRQLDQALSGGDAGRIEKPIETKQSVPLTSPIVTSSSTERSSVKKEKEPEPTQTVQATKKELESGKTDTEGKTTDDAIKTTDTDGTTVDTEGKQLGHDQTTTQEKDSAKNGLEPGPTTDTKDTTEKGPSEKALAPEQTKKDESKDVLDKKEVESGKPSETDKKESLEKALSPEESKRDEDESKVRPVDDDQPERTTQGPSTDELPEKRGIVPDFTDEEGKESEKLVPEQDIGKDMEKDQDKKKEEHESIGDREGKEPAEGPDEGKEVSGPEDYQKDEATVKEKREPSDEVLKKEPTTGPSKDDKLAEPSKDDKLAEPSKDDKLAKPSKDDKLAEPSKDDKLAEPSKDDKLAEHSKDDKLAELGVPLRSEFQKIVEGDMDMGEMDEVSGKHEFPLKKKFIQISETLGDGEVEKGQLEEISKETFANKDEVISALQKKLEEQRKSNELAERAINQLENIKGIIESSGLCAGEGVLCSATCKFVCRACPNLLKRANDIGNKKQKLEDLMRERDQLLLKVSELEAKLSKSDDLPGKIKQFAVDVQKEISTIPPNELQHRLDQVVGLEVKVQDLVTQILDKEETCATGCTDGQGRDGDKDKTKLADMEKALQKSQMVNAENEMLKKKLQELSNCEKEQVELKRKLSSMEEDNKSKHDKIRNMEKEYNCLSNQLENVKQLKKEKDMMQRQVGDLECCIADLEDEIKRLVGHIDRLTEGRDEQQSRMQNAMSDIRAELEKKTSLIEKSEEKLCTVQDKLEKSIRRVTSETTVYKNKIEDLENNLSRKEEQIKNLNKNLAEKDKIIENLNRTKRETDQPGHSEDSIIRNLKQDLDNSIRQNEKLQRDLEKLIMFNNNETSTQKMLTQSKAAIKRIREEIERQYKEWEAGSGEDYERVEELKGRINLLETEVSQMKNINEELKGALQNQKKCTCLTGIENTALKKHSSEIQNIAKHQVEELLEHLKKAQTRILELEELLNEAKQPKSNAELKDVDATCDIESEDLQRLKKENEVLKQQLQDIPRTSPAIDQDLLNEIQRLKNEKASLESDKLKLEKENENLKTKSQFTKTGSRQSSIQLSAEQSERVKELDNLRQSLEEQIALLKNENESLRNEIENLKNTLKEGPDDQLKASIELLKNENQDLKKSLEDMVMLKKQLAECLDKEIELTSKAVTTEGNLRKENDELANEISELEAKLQQMEIHAKQLKEELEKELEKRTKEIPDTLMQDELKNRLQELEKQNKQMNEQLENNLKEKSQIAATEESLKKENDEMKSKLQDLDKLNKENSELEKKLKELENLVQEKSHIASAEKSLNKEIEDLKNKLQDLEKSKKELLDTLDKHKKENTDLKGKLQEMENLKEELSKCLDNEKKSKTQISVSEDALKKQNLELKNKLQDIENLKKDLAECLDKGKKGDTTAVNELNKKIEEMEVMKKELTLCLDSEKKSKSQLLASEEALKKQNAELKNKLGEIEKLKKELAECLDNEKKGKSEAAATDNALQKQNAELKNKLGEIEKLKKELAECLDNEKKGKSEAASTDNALQKQNAELKKKLEDMEKIKKELAECLENEKKAEMQAPDDTLEKEITELKKKLDDLEKLKKELAECQERERKARGDADDALKNLEICNNNNAVLKKEVENLSSKLAEYLTHEDGDEPGLALDDFKAPNKTKTENEQLRGELAENEESKKLAEEVRQLKEQLAQCLEGQSPDDAQASREKGDADLDEMKIEFRSAPIDLEDSDDVTKEELLAEIRRLLKEIEDQKAEYMETIKMQKEQYDREVKNLKNTNRVSIEKLQNQHDDQVQELESQHDLDVKHLKKELRRSQMSMEKLAASKNRLSAQTFCVCSEMPKIVPIITTLAADIGIPQKESPYDRPGRWPKPKGTQDNLLNQILFKAIQNGMASLSMDELKMIYADLVKAIAKLQGKVIPSKMKSTTVEDPMTLMEKIEELEHNLHHKQRGANQKVVTLYATIRAVEKKISDMKNVLEKEKVHNADLKSKITSMERESQILQVERDLMKQQASFQEHQIAKLQTHYESSRMRIKDLETDLTRKKVKKAPGKCSFCNENKEAYDKRFSTSSKKRSTSSPPTSFSGKSPYSVPQIDLPSPSDRKDKTKRTKKGT